jgi:putative ATP-binding cassette transporter
MRSLFRTISVLLRYSKGDSRGTIALAAASSVIAGLASTALIATVNSALSSEISSRGRIIFIFGVLCIMVPVANFSAAFLLIRLTGRAAQDLRMQLSRAILASPYHVLEEIGAARIIATLTEDIPSLKDAITDLPFLLSQFAIMLACLSFLGHLSLPLLPAVIAYMALGISLQQFSVRKALRYWKASREAWDSMFKAIRGLTEGTKELKLHRKRRDEFLARQVDRSAKEICHNEVWGGAFSAAAGHGGQSLFFIFIGLILFTAPMVMYLDHRVLTGYVLTILFMMGPLTVILNVVPRIGRANIAANKIDSLGLSLTSSPAECPAIDRPRHGLKWSRLDLVDVMHTYQHDGAGDEFCLGPINLTLYPGELLFVIGGNGSGKTTLAKILVGLYEPKEGVVRLDGTVIDRNNRDTYRQYFSAVFDDSYLFEELFGIESQEIDEKGLEYLRSLQLDHKVQIRDGKLSTINLSRGQRKRLALLTAYLEDRPIYVFDEWASDQDPLFKQVFYLDILPELKARGKTAIIITHDDRYYSTAERVIKLERGQVDSDRRPAIEAAAAFKDPSIPIG